MRRTPHWLPGPRREQALRSPFDWRASILNAAITSLFPEPLATSDRRRQHVGGRSERADPPRVVGARGVVGEVEVEQEALSDHAEIGALDRVEHVAPAAVGLRAARG